MNNDTLILSTILGVTVPGITCAFGYVLANKRASGRVATTDADTLWRQLTEQLTKRDTRITDLEAASSKLAGELAEKEAHISRIERLAESLVAENDRKDLRIAVLEAQKNQLEARVTELETELHRRLIAARAASHIIEEAPEGGE